MNIECTYQTPRRLCDVISPQTKNSFKKLTKRPWNRFNPDLTTWWLVPDTKAVHFKHGKYYFNWGDKKHTSLLAGLYIEKGLDEKLAVVYSSRKAKSFMMSQDWAWYSFVESLQNRQFFDLISKEFPPDLPIEFIIDGGYVAEPTSFDPYQEKTLSWDQYIFTWLPGSDTISLKQANRKGFVLKLHHIKNIDELAASIAEYSENEWLWMNIHVAIRLQINPSSDNEEITWTDKIIWDKFLSKLATWIK